MADQVQVRTENDTGSTVPEENRPLQELLERRVAELWILQEIGQALQSAMELDRILLTILVGATAHQGLSFNRAFLWLVDDEAGRLAGRAALGPRDHAEADRIWSELGRTRTGLKDLLRDLEPLITDGSTGVEAIVRSLAVPLDGNDFLARALRSRATVVVEEGRDRGTGDAVQSELLEQLGTDSFVAVPLVTEELRVGLMLADNAITRRTIEPPEIQLLEMLGVQAALAIHRARLTGEIESHATALEAATREIQENQRRLLQAERLSALGHMAASLAHEIRNPLVVIGGFARSLREKTSADQPAHESLSIIVDEVRRLETIVESVLKFSKDPVPQIASIDLGKIASEGFDLLQWEMDQAGVIGSLEIEDDCGNALGDRDQIFQALINLMHNAIHAMPEGGNLTIGVARQGGMIELVVDDTGTGIPEAVRDRIREPFFTTKPAGTGLGMTIVSQIIRNHLGEIDIRTGVNSGTMVSIRLPAAED